MHFENSVEDLKTWETEKGKMGLSEVVDDGEKYQLETDSSDSQNYTIYI